MNVVVYENGKRMNPRVYSREQLLALFEQIEGICNHTVGLPYFFEAELGNEIVVFCLQENRVVSIPEEYVHRKVRVPQIFQRVDIFGTQIRIKPKTGTWPWDMRIQFWPIQ